MGPHRRTAVAIALIALTAIAATRCTLWRGASSAALDWQVALDVLDDPTAPIAHRRAAAAILVIYCRASVRALQASRDIADQVDLLLPQLEAMIREHR